MLSSRVINGKAPYLCEDARSSEQCWCSVVSGAVLGLLVMPCRLQEGPSLLREVVLLLEDQIESRPSHGPGAGGGGRG